MGGTASVLQHNKSKETSLLRLYNRHRCNDSLSENKLHARGVEDSKRLPSYTDGQGSKNHPVQVLGHTVARSGTPPSRLVSDCEALEHNSPSNAGSSERQQQCRLAKPPPDHRHAERTRVRDRLLVQVYNRCHSDFSSSLEDLKVSLQQCSIDGTGWATVTFVSAVMKKAGITIDEAAVLLLATELGTRNNHNNTGYAHEQRQDNSAAKSAPRAPLVYWPNIIDFVEQGPAAGFGYCGNDVQCTEKWRTSTPSTNNVPSVAKRRFDSEAKKSTRPEDLNVSPSGAGQTKDDKNPEMTPESRLERRDGLSSHGGDGSVRHKNKEGDANERSCLRLRQGLHDISFGLREVTVHGTKLSPRQIKHTMDSIREILEAQTGMNCGEMPSTPGGESRIPLGERGPHVREEGAGEVQSETTPHGCCVAEARATSLGPLGTESLVSTACAAGKRGDIPALKGIADSVDLKRNDDFGRNALYYACLCGHVHAAHFVVVRAYGDVEGIPHEERRECRMNALSEEIRRYLDTGISPGATPRTQEAKQNEGRPVQAVRPGRDKYSPSGAERIKPAGAGGDEGSVGDSGRVVDARESSLGGAHKAASSADGALSGASLFGWGHDREKEADY
ncbi:unnamed protein product [Ectocarpus sp. 12 AP-2014]